MKQKKIEAIDLFCGIGGLSYGLKKSGVGIIAGLDSDISCRNVYEQNINAKFIHSDIAQYNFNMLNELYSKESVKVLVGCAPCQPFSSISSKRKNKDSDVRWHLVKYFTQAIQCIKPDIVSMENVEGFTRTNIFSDFIESLQQQQYFINYKVVFCPDYGIPQKRKRLVLLASKTGLIEIPKQTHVKKKYVLVKDIIYNLPRIDSGEVCRSDSLHRTSKLSNLNMKRIRQSKPNGTWKDWNPSLLPQCYTRKSGKGYSSVYGRMDWEDLAPTITTQFCNIGSGRFGHPEQDRAISLREGALLQTFSRDYCFDSKVPPTHIAKHIGNAVPPQLGKVIGKSISNHVEELYD